MQTQMNPQMLLPVKIQPSAWTQKNVYVSVVDARVDAYVHVNGKSKIDVDDNLMCDFLF